MNKVIPTKRLIEEVLSMKEQYQIEVGSRRKPWPKSIKNRILELYDQGMPMKQISNMVKIPYQTIMSWRFVARKNFASKKEFHALAVKNPTVTVGLTPVVSKPPKIPQLDTTVIIRTPDGYALEIPSSIAVEFLSKIRSWK